MSKASFTTAIHSGRFYMEPQKYMPWKRSIIIFQTIMFRLYVNFRGCKIPNHHRFSRPQGRRSQETQRMPRDTMPTLVLRKKPLPLHLPAPRPPLHSCEHGVKIGEGQPTYLDKLQRNIAAIRLRTTCVT